MTHWAISLANPLIMKMDATQLLGLSAIALSAIHLQHGLNSDLKASSINKDVATEMHETRLRDGSHSSVDNPAAGIGLCHCL